ncbi:hypothetical protein [Streptomyces sp. STR69]|uniref:hypothetical protein n=1 Tax=Streptomyces sp. STR69 TaxID=1796942 RepID=UPI0021C6302D|nr:hypothetical protein [Streptomyces sp. STR69]
MADRLPLTSPPVVGTYRVIPPMARFSGSAGALAPRPAPLVGQDTQDVLNELRRLEESAPIAAPEHSPVAEE